MGWEAHTNFAPCLAVSRVAAAAPGTAAPLGVSWAAMACARRLGFGSADSIAQRKPAGRIVAAVVGPIAAKTDSPERRRKFSVPAAFAKFSKAEGLAKTKQSAPSCRIWLSTEPLRARGAQVL